MAQVLERHRVPGVSIAVVHQGRVDWAKGYGVCEAGKPGRVDSTTLFQAASISKPISAVLALRMVGMGQLSLDEDVNRKLWSWRIPETEFTKKERITLRRLLSHSAGLPMHGVPSYPAGARILSLADILDGKDSTSAGPVRPVVVPGTTSRYSGGGYIVLQLLLTDVAGQPFAPLARDLVLQPAGMFSSTFQQPLPEHLRSQAAVGHLANGSPVPGSWHTYPEQAAGGLWTTPGDLSAFMIEIWKAYHGKSDSLLTRDLARQMLTRQAGDFGLGLYLPAVGVFRFQHGGANVGYRCHMVLSVEVPEGVVVMTNGEAGEQVINEVFEAIAYAYGWMV
jgi:CubicO group peptidase (beta-lactamase class C family)